MLSFALGALIASIGWGLYVGNLRQELEGKIISNVYYESPFETEALKLWSLENHLSVDQSRERRLPVAFQLGDDECVTLEPKKGVIGSTEIFCFSKDDKKLVKRESHGE